MKAIGSRNVLVFALAASVVFTVSMFVPIGTLCAVLPGVACFTEEVVLWRFYRISALIAPVIVTLVAFVPVLWPGSKRWLMPFVLGVLIFIALPATFVMVSDTCVGVVPNAVGFYTLLLSGPFLVTEGLLVRRAYRMRLKGSGQNIA